MSLAEAFALVKLNSNTRFFGQRLQRAIRTAASAGFGTLLAGGRIIHDERSVHQAH